MYKAFLGKLDVKCAMYHNELGWIDFVWGDRFKGIKQIIEQRMTKDGLSVNDIYKLLTKDLVNTIASGKIIRQSQISNNQQMVIAKGDYEAILVKNKGNNGWLLTGWKLKPSDAIKAGNDTKKATQLRADSTDNKLGAEAISELSALAEQYVNTKSSFSNSIRSDNLKVQPNLLQQVSPKRTGKSGMDRIFKHPLFDGQVKSGAGYIFVDDTITQGGTFASLSAHVTNGGGLVIANIALTEKYYSSKISNI
jgi:hypothetical protein